MAIRSSIVPLFLAALLWAFFCVPGAAGHERETPDNILKSIGVDEKRGAAVPRDLVFRDDRGESVTMGRYLGKGPVVLTLNYYTCPMLCPLNLRNLLSAAERMGGISLAGDFRIVTVSIDPQDGPEKARARADEMREAMEGVGDPESAWSFLVGEHDEIDRLAEAVGFRYAKVGVEFAHPNAVVVLSADGRISSYVYGIEPDPRDLKLALIEAAEGRIGGSPIVHRALLFCYRYDPVERKYALYARNVMKAGGVLTLVFIGVLYLLLFRRGKPGNRQGSAGGK